MAENVPTKLTPVTPSEAQHVLFNAWFEFLGHYPSRATLKLSFCQMALETGHFQVLRNFNVGNIKYKGWEGVYQMYPAGEYIDGKHQMFYPPHRQTWFRTYNSLREGMLSYLDFIASRRGYEAAWAHLVSGSLDGFVRALSDIGYFTDSLDHYMSVMHSVERRYRKQFEVFELPALTEHELSILDGTIAVSLDGMVRDLLDEPVCAVCNGTGNFYWDDEDHEPVSCDKCSGIGKGE